MVSKHVFMLFLGKIERVLILATPKIKTTETRCAYVIYMDIVGVTSSRCFDGFAVGHFD